MSAYKHFKGYKTDRGIGSAVRPSLISEKEFDDNWSKIFGSTEPKKLDKSEGKK